MIEDSLLQYQLRKLEGHIENKRTELETCATVEEMHNIQGYLEALRVMRDILREQYGNWIRGEEEAEAAATSLEYLLRKPEDEQL